MADQGKTKRNWTAMDEEAERQGTSIRFANTARAMPNGKGKKVGKGQFRS